MRILYLALLSLGFFFFFSCSGDHRDLHSFPTRRSSDLVELGELEVEQDHLGRLFRALEQLQRAEQRSEEHTSELQSHHDLVCRLLLEKKKKKHKHPQLKETHTYHHSTTTT